MLKSDTRVVLFVARDVTAVPVSAPAVAVAAAAAAVSAMFTIMTVM